MAKIYLSSTFSDLKDHRAAVYHILRMLRHDVISMEDYVAGDQRPLDKCLEDVRNCDIYVGLIAWRYGFIPDRDNPEQKSITEQEYRQAVTSDIPQLIFLAEDGAPWPEEIKDSETGDGDNGQYIAAFRSELGNDKIVSYFKTPEQLAGLVSVAVQNHLQDNPVTRPVAANSRVKEVKRKAAEQRLNAIIEEYQAVTARLADDLDPVNQTRLGRQMENLQQKMEQIAQELEDIEQS